MIYSSLNWSYCLLEACCDIHTQDPDPDNLEKREALQRIEVSSSLEKGAEISGNDGLNMYVH